MAKNAQIYVTENEIAELLSYTDLPMRFKNQFTKDYAAIKRDITKSGGDIDGLTQDIDALKVRVSVAESNIASLNTAVVSLDTRLGIVEVDLSLLGLEFQDHVDATEAHGATGDIVGTNDYCTALLGGTVLLASALAASPASTLEIISTPNAAGAAYLQADAATWVAAINEIKADFNALITEYNALVAKVNAIIDTQEVAKQRAP